jgi:Parkin co-regulated protein
MQLACCRYAGVTHGCSDVREFKHKSEDMGDAVTAVLEALETSAGKQAFPVIKYFIPTYMSCL